MADRGSTAALSIVVGAPADHRDGGVIRLHPEHSKNGRGRTVAIEGDLCAIVDRRVQARVIAGKDGEPEHIAEFLFHRGGKPAGAFRKAWAAACIEAGLYRVVEINPDGSEQREPTRHSAISVARVCATWCAPGCGSA